METPQRKRPRSETPHSLLSRHVNKRFRRNSFISPSPKTVRFNPAIEGAQNDTIDESDVPESPIKKYLQVSPVSGFPFASGQPKTPEGEINVPFAKLNLKSSTQKKNTTTPVVSKITSEGPKSINKSAKKTPGSAKSNKVLPFRIKVCP